MYAVKCKVRECVRLAWVGAVLSLKGQRYWLSAISFLHAPPPRLFLILQVYGHHGLGEQSDGSEVAAVTGASHSRDWWG